jgi:hypothetical protein
VSVSVSVSVSPLSLALALAAPHLHDQLVRGDEHGVPEVVPPHGEHAVEIEGRWRH